MFKYKFSYKADSTNEVIGTVTADSEEDAIDVISKLKHLLKHQIVELFNIERINS